MLNVEVREDAAVFDELSSWWNSQPGPQRSVFLRAEWFRTIATSWIGPADRLQVFVVMDGEDPIAALPLYRSGHKLRSLTELSTEAFDLIHGGDPRPVDKLLSVLNSETVIRFEALVEESVLMSMASRSARWHRDNQTWHAILDLSGGAESVFSGLGRNMRSNLRRGMKNLRDRGSVEVEWHSGEDRVSDVLSQGLRLEAAGWKGRSNHAVVKSERRARFFAELARVAQERDWLRLGALYVDQQMVAFQFDLEYAGRQVLLITTFDETFSAASPGNVLLWNTIEAGMERGVTAYELGSVGDRKAWKKRWTPHASPRFYYLGFGNGPAGRIAHTAWRARGRANGVKHRVAALL